MKFALVHRNGARSSTFLGPNPPTGQQLSEGPVASDHDLRTTTGIDFWPLMFRT